MDTGYRSRYSGNREQFLPPKKKSKVWIVVLIIIIIIVIIVVIVIIIIVRRNGTNSIAKCTSNANCSSGQFCNTTTGNCVQCLTSANCTGGQVCNSAGVCVSPPVTTCTTNADCTGGKICSGGQCITPVGCTVNADCNQSISEICGPGNTCTCQNTAPTITAVTGAATASSDAKIMVSGTYTFVQPNSSDLKSQTIISDPATGTMIKTTPLSGTLLGTINDSSTVNDIPTKLNYYPNVPYKIEQVMDTTCLIGTSQKSASMVMTPTSTLQDPSFGTSPFDSAASDVINILVSAVGSFNGGPFANNTYPKMAIIIYKTAGIHPNFADHFFPPVAVVSSGPFYAYDYSWTVAVPPVPPADRVSGKKWYIRCIFIHESSPGIFIQGELGPEFSFTIV